MIGEAPFFLLNPGQMHLCNSAQSQYPKHRCLCVRVHECPTYCHSQIENVLRGEQYIHAEPNRDIPT
jgi:hypothetical protein